MNRLSLICYVIVCATVAAPADPTQKAAKFGYLEAPRIYDCAANSLYVLCQITSTPVRYANCLELLPIRTGGNSMLEVKRALESLSFNVYARRLAVDELPNIRVPSIILGLTNEGKTAEDKVGHFFAVRPVNGEAIQVLDYPFDPNVVAFNQLIPMLKARGYETIPVLLCGRGGQRLGDVLARRQPPVDGGDLDPTVHASLEVVNSGDEIILTDGRKTPFSLHWDSGKIPESSVLTHDFLIRNATGREIRTKELKAGCSCVGIEVDNHVIRPNARAIVSMRVSLVQKYGEFGERGIVVFAPECGLPPVQLTITGESQARWLCYPHQTVDFGDCVPEGENPRRSVTLKKSSYGDGTIVSHVRSSSQSLIADLVRVSDGEHEVALLLRADQVMGAFSARVDVFLNKEEIPATYIDVQACVLPLAIVSPTRLLFIEVDGVYLDRLVQIRQRDRCPFELTAYRVDGLQEDSLQLRFKFDDTHTELSLVVTPLRGVAGSKGNIVLELEFDDGRPYELTVPLTMI